LTWAIWRVLRHVRRCRLGDFASSKRRNGTAEEKYYLAFVLILQDFDIDAFWSRAIAVWPPGCKPTGMTNRIAIIAFLPFVSATRVLANGIADMSGTTFTQQLHASSHSLSILPTLAILVLGAGFALAMRSEPCREAVPADPQDSANNYR
jgi:hypothetical protein